MGDITVTAASALKSARGITEEGIAGATITAGQPLYADASASGTLKPADALTAAKAAVVGIALNGAGTGQPVEYLVSDPDYVAGGTVAVGQVYVVSATGGGIALESDITSTQFVTVIGIGKTATTIALACDPRFRGPAHA